MSILRLKGSPREMGLQHGRSRTAEIRRSLDRLQELSAAGSLDLADASLAASHIEAYFGPDELEELHGIAEGAEAALEQIAALNLALYLDAGGGGLHFALTAEANEPHGLLHGANEDLVRPSLLVEALGRSIFVRHPIGAIPHVTFGVAGQVGGLVGINAAGLTVSSAALLDVETAPAKKAARLHTVFVKNILERVAEIDEAIALYIADPGCTPYSICMTQYRADRIGQFEYDLNLLKNMPWTPDVIGTTHRMMRTNPGDPPELSRRRCERLRELLGGDVPTPTAASKALLVLRDRYDADERRNVEEGSATTVCRSDCQMSVLFHPAEGSLWVTSPLREANRPGVFYHFRLDELLPEFSPFSPPARHETQSRVKPAIAATPRDEIVVPPLVDAVVESEFGKRLVAESHLDPAAEVFLVQHRFKDRPLMPLAVMVEALAEAASMLAGPSKRVIGLRDVEIQNGLRFTNDDMQAVRVTAVAHGNEIECQFTCDVKNRKGDVLLKDKPHLRGIVDVAAVGKTSGELQPFVVANTPSDPTKWVRCFYTENIVIYHGPVFRCLRALAIEGDYAWGSVVALPMFELAGKRNAEGWLLNPSLLDACLYSCGSFLWLKNRGTIAVPDGFEQLRLARFPRPSEKCLVTMLDRGRAGDRSFYDFSVTGEDGAAILEVLGYRNQIVAEEPAPAN